MKALRWQTLTKVACFLLFLYAAHQLTYLVVDSLNFQLRPSNEDAIHRSIIVSAILYSSLLALPFVPGAEIGMALLVTLGPPIALLVYGCTVVGLCISFSVGKLVPMSLLGRGAKAVGLTRMAALVASIEPLEPQERLSFLTGSAPNRMVPLLLRSRYVGLGLLFNTPGNFLIGGGGGIGLIAGASGLFSFTGYLATILIAVSPVPLAVSLFGVGFLT